MRYDEQTKKFIYDKDEEEMMIKGFLDAQKVTLNWLGKLRKEKEQAKLWLNEEQLNNLRINDPAEYRKVIDARSNQNDNS